MMDVKAWKWIYKLIQKNSSLFLRAIFSGLAYNFFVIAIPISISRFYELGFGFSSHKLKAFSFIPFLGSTNTKTFLGVFIVLVGCRLFFDYYNRYSIALIGERLSKLLREALFAHQLQVVMPIYNEKGIGKYLLRFSGDLKSIQNYVKFGLVRFVQDVVLLLAVLVVIAYIDSYLALLILGTLVPVWGFLYVWNTKLYNASLEQRNRKSGMLSFVNTCLRGIVALKAFNRYYPEEKRYLKRSDKLYNAGRNYAQIASLIKASVPAITYTILGVVMGYVLFYMPKAHIETSALLALILLVISVLPILRRSLRVSIVWKLGAISFYKLIKVFELPYENDLPTNKDISLRNAPLVFDAVTFKYETQNEPSLQDFSIRIEPNAINLIYGPSGSGKSTFLKLLLKLEKPHQGTISLGAYASTKLSEKAIRRHIAVASKALPLYGKDVYTAVVYLRNHINREKAQKLLNKLQQNLPQLQRIHLDTPIGDMGNNLSSGQMKLVVLCRALLTQKPILVIENPFRDLHPEITSALKQMLQSLRETRTIILIDQHPITALHVDHQFQLCHGRLVFSGISRVS